MRLRFDSAKCFPKSRDSCYLLSERGSKCAISPHTSPRPFYVGECIQFISFVVADAQIMGRRESLRLAEFRAIAEREASEAEAERLRLSKLGSYEPSSLEALRHHGEEVYSEVIDALPTAFSLLGITRFFRVQLNESPP